MSQAGSPDPRVCFYCLDTQNTVCVCLGCKSKLEMARDDLARLKRDMELRRAAYWKTQNARKAEIKRDVASKIKGKKKG